MDTIVAQTPRLNKGVFTGSDAAAVKVCCVDSYVDSPIHRRASWKTREAVELATLDWVQWFSHHRMMESLG